VILTSIHLLAIRFLPAKRFSSREDVAATLAAIVLMGTSMFQSRHLKKMTHELIAMQQNPKDLTKVNKPTIET
jgi:hypothetical protein